MGRQSLKAGYEFQHINVEVQDVNPLYGLDSYTGQFTRPAGAAANNLYNLADFMLGLRSQYALSTFLRREHAAEPALHLRAGRHPRQRQADAQRRAALRVRDADVGSEQRPDELRSGHEDDDHGEGRIDCRPRARRSGSQQLRAAARVRLHAAPRHGGPRRLGHQLRARQPHRIGEPARHQRPAGRPRRRSTRPIRPRRLPCRRSRAIRRASPIRRSSTR